MYFKAGGSALVFALALGCAANKTATPGDIGVSPASAPATIAAVAGTYALVTVDDHALPYASRALGPSASPIVSGSLVVDAKGTFQLQTSYGASTATGPATGTCYPDGNELKMVWDGGGLTDLTLRGDTVLIKREGAVYRYLRTR